MSEFSPPAPFENKKQRILLAEDDQGLAELLYEELDEAGYLIKIADSAETAEGLLKAWEPDLVISDLKLPGADGMTLLQWAKALYDQPGFLIITAFGSIAQAVDALKSGADDFLAKPLDLEHFRLSVKRILHHRQLQKEVMRFRNLMAGGGFQGMIGNTRQMRIMFDQIREIAAAQGPVLILGESGVGKELVARAVHDLSPRRNAPFLAVNCAGIPADLLESEFFGHEEGAFTGAAKKRQGLFQQTHKGSLFLDEIGELPVELQAKLLRVIQDGEFERLGSSRTIKVDTRIIAATNRNLEEEVKKGNFREDLWYRLNVFPITMPPLRDRADDIPYLVDFYVNKISRRMGKTIEVIPAGVMDTLKNYDWPGNIRELENVLERAVINSSGPKLRLADELKKPLTDLGHNHRTLEAVERDHIIRVLEQTGWKVGGKNSASEILGLDRSTLRAKMRKLNIQKP